MKFVRRCKVGDVIPKSGKRVAIIGAGPSGLSAAGELVCEGHEVHVYDMMPEPGGLLIFGIPVIRMPKDNIRKGINELAQLGVVFHQNIKVGRDIDLEEIISNYDATLIATGAWRSRKLNVKGEDLKGVYDSLEFLLEFNMHRLGYIEKETKLMGTVLVVGGGFTAVDACSVAMEVGADDVILSYRRTRNEAPAGPSEFDRLEKKGIKIYELTAPVEFISSNGNVCEAKLIRMKLGPLDSSGRPTPVPIEGSEFTIKVNAVLLAVGEIPTPPFVGEKYGIELTRWGSIKVDKKSRTTRRGVFAAGDVVTGPSRIATAVMEGRKAAESINEFLRTGEWKFE